MNELNSLVIKAKKGDKAAEEEIINKLKPSVLKIASSIYVVGYTMEDLVSIGNLTILKSIKYFNEQKCPSFASYVTMAIKNNLYYEIRKFAKNGYESSLDAPSEDGVVMMDILEDDVNIEDEALKEVENMRLRKAIAKLSERDRTVIEDLYFNKIKIYEYAKREGIAYTTALKRKNKALEKLRFLLI